MIEREFIKDSITGWEIKEYLRKRLRDALISSIDVFQTPLITRIVIKAAKPGLVIGRKGATIREITEEIEKRFGVKNPQIEVIPVDEPYLDAKVQATRIAIAIESGQAWRPLINITLRRIMERGARGAEIVVKGKLGAKGARAMIGRAYAGYMKKVGEPAKLVDIGKAEAYTKWGIVGVTVRIVRPDTRFPDEVVVPTIEVVEDEGEGAEGQGEGGAAGATQ